MNATSFSLWSLCVAAALPLAACGGDPELPMDTAGAQNVITRTIVARYPGVDLPGAVPCAMQNATRSDLAALADQNTTAPNPASDAVVEAIFAKPETQACLAEAGLPSIMR